MLSRPNINSQKIIDFLGVSQTELLDIFCDRFGNILLQTIKEECRNRPTRSAIQRWLLLNACGSRRLVSHAIKTAREQSGLTQKELAERMNIKRGLVAKIENSGSVSVERVRLIAEILNNVEFNQFLFDIGWIDRF
jgi:DNA-binding XRE family transcriptional regulator